MNNFQTESEVMIFYDETKVNQYNKLWGHALFFVPVKLKIKNSGNLFEEITESTYSSLEILSEGIHRLRETFGISKKFHFTDIGGRKWTKYNEAEKRFIGIGVDALRRFSPTFFEVPLMCKFAVIFFDEPSHRVLSLYGGNNKNEKKLRYSETILRILLKGALHFLYDENNTVRVLKIICDGDPYHRTLSEERILWKLIQENMDGLLREYVDIQSDAEIIHLNSDHKRYEVNSEEYVYANLLQMTDMLLGSVIQSCLKGIRWQKISPRIGDQVLDKKSIIAFPVKEMLDKRKRGTNFKYSSHYKSFAISKACIVGGQWKFDDITTKDITIDHQGNLLLYENWGKTE